MIKEAVKIIPKTSFVAWLSRLSSNEGSAGAFSHSLCSIDVWNDSLPITMGSVKLVSLTANPPPGRRDRSVRFDICRQLSRAQRVTEE